MTIAAYPFDHSHELPADALRKHLGGKGAALVTMTAAGIPVPPGFTMPTTTCLAWMDQGWTSEMDAAIERGVAGIESAVGRRLGDSIDPLLVSVRSGAATSMPGMMDTVLNVGMTTRSGGGLVRQTGDDAFAADTQRRAVQSWGAVVGGERPADPMAQIARAVEAVFRSWGSDRAIAYREREGIDHGHGTAATVQAMVFGNMGHDSGTGVAFSRDPATGEPGLMGDFLVNAQGEDVVAGTHRTMPLAEMATRWPDIHADLVRIAHQLEHRLADLVDIEFTVERQKLWILQSRPGKRSPQAALRIAVAMAEDPDFPLDRSGAVTRCRQYLEDPPLGPAGSDEGAPVVATGLAASPGRSVGRLCVDVDEAVVRSKRGQDVVLIRHETSPADVHGMRDAVGLVTSRGGMVSHAAVVARAWGLPAVVGAADLEIVGTGVVGLTGRIDDGTIVTVDGDGGHLLLGSAPGSGQPIPEVAVLLRWAEEDHEPQEVFDEGSEAAGDLALADCLRVVVIKGMAIPRDLTDALHAPEASIERCCEELVGEGLLERVAGDRVRPTPSGQDRIEQTFIDEGRTMTGVLGPLLDGDFHRLNSAFKEVVAAWQLRDIDGESVPNDHADPDYDASVRHRLRADIHAHIIPLVGSASASLPRLAGYAPRFTRAMSRFEDGDDRYMAHPLLDSYHTVWFELHEDLIRLAGRDRATEAEAGRA